MPFEQRQKSEFIAESLSASLEGRGPFRSSGWKAPSTEPSSSTDFPEQHRDLLKGTTGLTSLISHDLNTIYLNLVNADRGLYTPGVRTNYSIKTFTQNGLKVNIISEKHFHVFPLLSLVYKQNTQKQKQPNLKQ